MLNQTSFCLKIKASYENSEMLPYDFMNAFYKMIIRDKNLREGKKVIEDINTDLIFSSLEKYCKNHNLDGDKPPKI